MAEPSVSRTLKAVARLVAEATTLRDVMARLAPLLAGEIPHDRLRLLRLDRAESVVLYSADRSGHVDVTFYRIGDPDAPVPEAEPGAVSRLICPLPLGTHVQGALWVTAERPDAFSDAHQALLDGVADLVSLAVQHDAIRGTESLQRERLDSLDRLLHTLGESLDIRQVFDEVSSVVRGGLPHNVLALTAWAADGRSFRLHAVAGAVVDDPALWEPTALSDEDRAAMDRHAYVLHDVARELDPSSMRARIFSQFGVQSVLRVPLPMGTDVFGSLFFLASEPERFSEQDIDFARRVADHLALALSHQRLAEAARRDAAARETATRLEAQVATLTRELESQSGRQRLVGHSPAWHAVLAQAARVARTATTVLLTGESGTGKEVVARFIHHGSDRKDGPFVAINCAALPDQLLESELFGFERGAFTGAVSSKPGRIEVANGGVLFLDEVGEMAPAVQAKLLRVLEEREFLHLGGTRLLKADIRVIAATNRDLQSAMRRGEFREDIYYRLRVFEIALPPLRERTEDILELAETFLAEIGEAVGRPALGIARDAKEALLDYGWPGNVRELRNAVERAVILADGGYIRTEHLPVATPSSKPTALDLDTVMLPASGVNLDVLERSLVARALSQARYNKTRAAKLLGLTRAQLYSRIDKYGLRESES